MSWLSNLFSKDEQQPSEATTPSKPQLTAAEYCERGKESLEAGKYVEAMEFFQAAIEADKRFEKAYLLLATAYEKQGKMDKDKATLYGLLAIDPNNTEALRRIDELNGRVTPFQKKPLETSTTIQLAVPNKNNSVYQIFDGKPEDAFDFFIMFDDGNRIYFNVSSK